MTMDFERVHLIGAGGAGMSALAKILVARGYRVSGSDLRGGPALDGLADLGVQVHVGHRPEAVADADVVVASSAVPEYDEELVAARKAGKTTWRRPDLLEALTSTIPTIGATGTHGKTTTTAMLITGLLAAGEDPWFVVGGDLAELGTNGHVGQTDLLVLEADEAFRTFESLHLDGLVVTNVEPEHLDHFGTEQDLLAAFIGVAREVQGPVLCCADDAGSLEVARQTGSHTYGLSDGADWVVSGIERQGTESRFVVTGASGEVGVTLSQPGVHNVRNAAGALALLGELGYPLEQAASGIGDYRGVGRRWEHRGTVAGVTLVDDYAHHPTEVEAVLDAAQGIVPGRIWAVFQPHLYSRTERFTTEFGEALCRADRVVVTDVFGARESPVPGINGELVAEAAREAGADVVYVARRSEIARYLATRVAAGDLVLSMGAGDITLLHGELAPLLSERS